MTLQKAESPEYPDVLVVALDAAHHVYHLEVCAFGDLDFPRLFLTDDPERGVDILLGNDVVDTITGRIPEVCTTVPLIAIQSTKREFRFPEAIMTSTCE